MDLFHFSITARLRKVSLSSDKEWDICICSLDMHLEGKKHQSFLFSSVAFFLSLPFPIFLLQIQQGTKSKQAVESCSLSGRLRLFFHQRGHTFSFMHEQWWSIVSFMHEQWWSIVLPPETIMHEQWYTQDEAGGGGPLVDLSRCDHWFEHRSMSFVVLSVRRDGSNAHPVACRWCIAHLEHLHLFIYLSLSLCIDGCTTYSTWKQQRRGRHGNFSPKENKSLALAFHGNRWAS